MIPRQRAILFRAWSFFVPAYAAFSSAVSSSAAAHMSTRPYASTAYLQKGARTHARTNEHSAVPAKTEDAGW